MDKPFTRVTADYCPKCKTRTLNTYDNRGKPIHYVSKNQTATTESIMEKINTTTISDMICSKCGTHFIIDYSMGFPRAIEDSALNFLFFNNYFNHNK